MGIAFSKKIKYNGLVISLSKCISIFIRENPLNPRKSVFYLFFENNPG